MPPIRELDRHLANGQAMLFSVAIDLPGQALWATWAYAADAESARTSILMSLTEVLSTEVVASANIAVTVIPPSAYSAVVHQEVRHV